MQELDKFLDFIYRNIDDDRISVHKKMKFGHRYYHISINMEANSDTFTLPHSLKHIDGWNQVSIILDNRNICLELISSNGNIITVENDELLKKWSDKYEEYLSSKTEGDIKELISTLFQGSKEKDLHREYLMEDLMEEIFKKDKKDNESI
jgi:hypothetical protein